MSTQKSELERVLGGLGARGARLCLETPSVDARYEILAAVVWPKDARLERVLVEAAEMDAGARERGDYTEELARRVRT